MKYNLPSIKRLQKSLRGKTVLVRVDYDAEKASEVLRLPRSLPTITHLLRLGAKVVLMGHRHRPESGLTKEHKPKFLTKDTTMKFAVPFLKKRLGGTPVSFFPHFDFSKIKEDIAAENKKAVFVLENLRFHPGEKGRDKVFAKELAGIADFYVNDAFATSHRNDTSLTLVPEFLPSYAGLEVLDEVEHLSSVMEKAHTPFVVVLGGGKAKDKFAVIKNLYEQADQFLIGGILGNTFLKARGIPIKKSIVDMEILSEVSRYAYDSKIEIARDWIFDEHERIMDIGALTRVHFTQILHSAKTVVWNGPMGKFEEARYAVGTRAVADAVAQSKAFSVLGGGETTQFILSKKLEKKFGFLSTGGGAMLAFLADKPMPGLEVLVRRSGK